MRGIYHLKRKLLLCVCTASCIFMGNGIRTDAAPVRNLPRTLEQPDGTTIECFVSGDEYFHYLHDMDGNMIMKNEDTGEYVYAKIENGEPTVSESRATRNIAAENPMLRYILKQEKGNVTEKITYEDIPEEYLDEVYESSPLYQSAVQQGMSLDQSRGEHRFKDKTVNNLVIFIDFADKSFQSTPTATAYDNMFNSDGDSLKAWMNEASYGHAKIVSSMYPKQNGGTVVAYRSANKRSIYENATDSNRTVLEYGLLKEAVEKASGIVPKDLNLDIDDDGYIDSLTFVVAGDSSSQHGALLWSHKWGFYEGEEKEYAHLIPSIDGFKAETYVFITEEDMRSEGVGTLTHEMFHLYGAPDLYHKNADSRYNSDAVNPDNPGKRYPVYRWDNMCDARGELTSTYMRYKYGGWIENVPEIKNNGRYTLNKASMSSGNCYYIRSPFSEYEYFWLEYRKREGVFETRIENGWTETNGYTEWIEKKIIPGTGLVIYKIDMRCWGNYNHDGKTVFNEVAISNRKPAEKYYPYAGTSVDLKLRDNVDAGIKIKNITLAGNQVTFDVELTAQRVGGYFRDKRVAQAIAKRLNKSVDALTEADLLMVTDLQIPFVHNYDLPIDLEGVDKLKNLSKLTADGCKIEDISYLSSLNQLTELDLRNNNIKTVAALSGLTNLQKLYLRGNLIGDYSPVRGYYNQLTDKDFSFQKLGDINIRVNSYNDEGNIRELKADMTNTRPYEMYLKYEKYSAEGQLLKMKKVKGAQYLFSNPSSWEIPKDFNINEGYVVVSGYERPDFKQLCAKAIIYPANFAY